MATYVVIVESDLRSGNINHRIRRSDALPQPEAEALFERVVRGEAPELLKPRDQALLVRTSERQVCRFWSGFTGGETLDRVTLAEVID